MKLIFAIVNNDDAPKVASALTKAGYFATKLASTGGFLQAGNTTFMIACDTAAVDNAVCVIAQNSRKRSQVVQNEAILTGDAPTSFPTEVSVGGATVFVTDIERFEKL